MNIDEILDLSLENRIEIYNKAKAAYYETSDPIMSDDDFDQLEDSITAESDDAKYVGVNSRHNKSSHTTLMPSLDKERIDKTESNVDEILERLWNNYGSESCTLSWKYDGLAMNVEFSNGQLKQIASRGNKLLGVDRTAKLRHIIENSEDWMQFIDYHQTGQVRCECAMTFKTFEDHYADSGKKHPRNMASGIVSDENLETGKNHIDLVVLEGIDSDGDVMDVSILPNYKKCFEDIDSLEELKDAFNQMRSTRHLMEYPTDGLVLSQQIYNRKWEHNGKYPNHAISIKFTPPKFDTVITNIEWNLQKTGRYVPKIFFEPFVVDGREIKQCSGHNLDFLVRHNMTVGSKIVIELSGDIIPAVSSKNIES